MTTVIDRPRGEEILEGGLLTIEQAAKALGVSTVTVWRLLASGDLGSVKIGKAARRIPRAEIATYVSERFVRR